MKIKKKEKNLQMINSLTFVTNINYSLTAYPFKIY